MAFDYQERKPPLLYADLFKSNKKTALEQHHNSFNSSSLFGSSSSLTRLSSFCDSSSSGFSTPFESELGSSESEDGDFIAELTREMAECMLQDDDDESYSVSDDYSEGIISPVKNKNELPVESPAVNNYSGLFPGPVPSENRAPSHQVYQVKNQPPVNKKSGNISPVGRFGSTEPTQPKNNVVPPEKPYMQYRGVRHWGNGKSGPKMQNGSGMQAVFLGGAGSKNGSSGTGVFLPRVANDPSEPKKKSGCSTVLIPTRVLQALEQHFNGRANTAVPPLNSRCGSSTHSYPKDESKGQRNGQAEVQSQPTTHEDQEMLLPQEWTY